MLPVRGTFRLERAAWLRQPGLQPKTPAEAERAIPEVLDDLGIEMEKRLPIAMIVNLARAQNCNGTELTYTDNVSAHGACIVSNHSWQPGEIAEITSMLDQIAMRGKVVHCRKRGDDQYTIGLSFPCEVVWSNYLRYAGRLRRATLLRQRVDR